jgi:LmbE family N-acetylglucosaminyl deacetylase
VESLLSRLQAGRSIPEPVALVVAHPDDEVVGLGSRLAYFERLTLIHLTAGAPRDGRDAHRAGFLDRGAYAGAREAELRAALDRLGVRATRIGYGIPDQETAHNLPELIERLRSDLSHVAALFTHPYEHGHPDHDSAALAVALAVPDLPRFEMAFYHSGPDGARFGRFWPDPDSPETVIPLSPDEQHAKAEALACFATQGETLAQFPLTDERIRPAPRYDFSRPAPPGAALYESWGFAESAADWRAQAARVLEPACAA